MRSMFTGIVQAKGRVAAIETNAFGARLLIDRRAWDPAKYKPVHGDSVCISGVCLTVVEVDDRTLAFDVIAETLAKSKLGSLRVGSQVNLEGSLTLNTPLGGHFMQGHVDGVGTVAKVHNGADEWRLTVQLPNALMEAVVPKGSVAIDGVSLTIARVQDDQFDVALIPTTLALTTLVDCKVGDPVNIETDIIAKTVVNYLRRIGTTGGGLTMDKLRAAGFGT